MRRGRPGTYLAECFWSGVQTSDLEALDERARRIAAATLGGDAPVAYLGSLLMADDEVVLCFFEGPSGEAVASVAASARIPFARIVPSIRIGDPTRPRGRERGPAAGRPRAD